MTAAAAPALALVGSAASIAGGLTSAQAAQQQYGAESQMYVYQAGVAAQNAQLAKQNAQYALMQGEEQAAQAGMQTRAEVGQIRAAQSASGLDIAKGTMPLVPKGAQTIGNINQTTIRSNASLAAYNQDVAAWQYGTQQQLDIMAASNASAAAPLASEASILGSAASVSSQWTQYFNTGIFNQAAGNVASTVGSWGQQIGSATAGAFGW